MPEHGIKMTKNSRGVSLTVIDVNGNIKPEDEFALFLMTEKGFSFYKEGGEFRAYITNLVIGDEPACTELPGRFKSMDEAIKARDAMPEDKKMLTLIIPVSQI